MAPSTIEVRPYASVEQKLVEGNCVILDGGIATELQRLLTAASRGARDDLWGSWALYRAPEAVSDTECVRQESDPMASSQWRATTPRCCW